MNVLIIGGTGLLGSALIRSAPKRHTLYATYFENKTRVKEKNVSFIHLDIRDKKEVEKVFKSCNPSVVVHTAAKSNPDFCEKHKRVAWDTNVNGTRNIIKVAKKHGSKVLFMSSNHVFSGKNPPYSETSRRDPVNYYGKTKVQSENDIKKHNDFVTVLRLMTMYGLANPNGTKNSAVWVIDMLRKKQPIKVVDDVFNNFLYVNHAAKIIWNMIDTKNYPKLIQLAGKDVASRFELAHIVAKEFGLDSSLLSAVKKSYFTEEAPRPLNTVYDTSLLEKVVFVKPMSLKKGIKDMHTMEKKILWEEIAK